ncbi:hypothetical protein [Nonomuraea soli]|uniref:Uncharacterized protein n=1 Tax=Nonomuraea soli TaxID=1032476 RepID=A0A7W0CU78_9ACTN|nr:hypothetical protein [Nonomuraea soli]MBA2897454.1 hypothetical protein [Nonomuraea soli]
MTGPLIDEEPAEHHRYRRYLQALDEATESDEAELVTTVLRDEDATMAESAVNRHLEFRATRLLTDPAFTTWAQAMATAIGDRPFLVRRLQEWALLRTIALDEPWTTEELTTASEWFQRTASSSRFITSRRALTLLAEQGRTRRVRDTASGRLPQPAHPRCIDHGRGSPPIL